MSLAAWSSDEDGEYSVAAPSDGEEDSEVDAVAGPAGPSGAGPSGLRGANPIVTVQSALILLAPTNVD